VTEAEVCEQLAQGCYLKVERPGVEPATFGVASPTLDLTTTPPVHTLLRVADVLSAADLSECAERSFASHISLAAAAAAAGGVTTATSGHVPGTARFARLGPSAERKFASRTRTGTERSVRRRRRMLLRVRPSSLARTVRRRSPFKRRR